jgi:N-acetylated-alpha-linked acidic dipeptidase
VDELEEARSMGELLKQGWKPRRTIIYCVWDGEEPGLLGSTEWSETHAAELRRKAVLYVNSDTNGRGFLFTGGSHSFQHEVNEVAGGVVDPETGASVLERLRARIRVAGPEGNAGPEGEALLAAADAGMDLPIEALGSGSDYTPFLQHLGISAVNLGFNGEDVDGSIYHSTYDSFDHFIRFGDPKFAFGVALAQTAGHLVLRTADADVLPMRFGDLGNVVARYVSEVERLTNKERDESGRIRRLIDEGAFRLASDPGQPRAAPQAPADVPRIDFRALREAATRLRQSAMAYDSALSRASEGDFHLPPAELKTLNGLLQGVEQTFLSARGLPGREWYQHMLYAPGRYTGYAAKTLPAIRESIELHEWLVAQDYIPVVAGVLNAAAGRLDEAASQLTPRLGPGPAKGGPSTPPPPDS